MKTIRQTYIGLLLINNKRPGLTIRALVFLLCSFFIEYKGQVNYVQNPSFEDIDSCTTVNFEYPPRHWDTLAAGGGGGPEICSRCSTFPGLIVPYTGIISFQEPHSGNNYCFFTNYIQNPPAPEGREYVQNELFQALKQGQKYCVTYFISLMNESKYAITEYGAYFDNGSISTAPYGISTLSPQIKSPSGVFMTDTLGWMKVQGTFTANGDETHLTLGNFKPIGNTTFSVMSGPRLVADYYVDDISVIEANLPAYAGRDTILCNGDSVFIGRLPEVGLECIWSTNSSTIASDGGLWVKPTGAQTFAVQQNVCGVFTYDTIQVQIKPKYTDAATLIANYSHFCFKDSLKLNLLSPPTDSDIKFSWQGPSLNNYTITNPVGIMQQNATYSISYSSLGDGTHCPYSYKKTISIELIDSCGVEPVFANIFTPNNDGVNDTWGINYKKVSYVKEITYTIYNRWGNLIFEGSASKMRWDGYTTSGIPCTDGIYFYIVTVKDIKDQIKKYEGNITLIR